MGHSVKHSHRLSDCFRDTFLECFSNPGTAAKGGRESFVNLFCSQETCWLQLFVSGLKVNFWREERGESDIFTRRSCRHRTTTKREAQKVGRHNKNLHSELLIGETMEESAPLEKLISSRNGEQNFIYIPSMLIRLFDWVARRILIFSIARRGGNKADEEMAHYFIFGPLR